MITLAGVVSLLLLALAVASLGWLHLQPTGLSPIRDAVSQYGITSFRAGYRVTTIAFGLSGIALAAGIYRAVPGGGRSLVVLLLVVFAAPRCLISWFPMDPPAWHELQAARRTGCSHCSPCKRDNRSAEARRHPVERAEVALSGEYLDGLGAAMAVCLRPARPRPLITEHTGVFRSGRTGLSRSAIAWFVVFSFACTLRP